jgi:DNA-binding transcriptional LysR family regulator
MELRHLRYFVAVAEELHFSRAAQRVGIAQPPLSQQIKTLEDEVGAPLFYRTKRKVELTAAGQAFLGEARRTLAQAEHALRVARRAARGEVGQLAIGFVSSAVYGRFASVFRIMRSQHAEVALTLHELTSEEQVEAVKGNRLDVGLVRPPVVGAEGLSLRSVSQEPLVAVLPQGHALSRQPHVALKALAKEPFLLVPRHLGPGFYDQIIRLCARAGFTPNVVQEARTAQTIISLVAAGMGVSLVPASLRNLRRTGVVYRPIEPSSATTELAALWRRDDQSPVLRLFLGVLWRVAEDHGERIA